MALEIRGAYRNMIFDEAHQQRRTYTSQKNSDIWQFTSIDTLIVHSDAIVQSNYTFIIIIIILAEMSIRPYNRV